MFSYNDAVKGADMFIVTMIILAILGAWKFFELILWVMKWMIN